MLRINSLSLLSVLGSLGFYSQALGLGFMIHEHGAAGTGMADARTAIADRPNTLFNNPAASLELPGLQFELGLTGILPYISYKAKNELEPRTYTTPTGLSTVNDGENDVDAKIVGFTPIHLYATYRIDDWGLSLGYALNNVYGLGVAYPEDWDGRFLINDLDLRTFCNQLTITGDLAQWFGFKDNLKLSLSAGPRFLFGSATLVRRIDFRAAEMFGTDYLGAEGEMRMSGTGSGFGAVFSLYAEMPKLLSFGAAFRIEPNLTFKGDALFWLNPAAKAFIDDFSSVVGGIPEKDKGSVDFNLPMSLNLGVAYLGVDRLKIALDFYYVFFNNFDELALKFESATADPPSALKDADPLPKDWTNAYQISLGVEYLLLDWMALRAGYALGSSPIPAHTVEPSLPDGRRDLFCVGVGFLGGFWKIDVGYMFFITNRSKQNDLGGTDSLNNPQGKANGDYTMLAHLLGLSATFNFF